MKKHERGSSTLLDSFDDKLKSRESHSGRRRLTVAAPDIVDFSSNDFLSLSRSQALRTAYLTELEDASRSLPLASGGSRLLDGNTQYAETIENELAAFYDAPAGLLFNSGFDANSGIFACVPQPEDAIIYDEYIHASVHEGMRLSRSRTRQAFRHNSVPDFRRVLEDVVRSSPNVGKGKSHVFVAIESVYSMDGDIAPIKEILEVISDLLPSGNGHLLVDEAHSSGVYGLHGRGLVHDLGLQDRILARLHTFGKALSSGGAILLCHPTMRDYLINYARSFIYTTAMGLPTLSMIKSVHSMLSSGGTVDAQDRLWQLVIYAHRQMSNIHAGGMVKLQSTEPTSPILSLLTSNPRSLATYCQKSGFMIRPIVPPTVPEGAQRVRVCLHASNNHNEIDRLVDCISRWAETEQRTSQHTKANI